MEEIRSLSSAQHPLVKHFVKLRNDAAYRNEQKLLVLEGLKPIKEMSWHLKRLLYTAEHTSDVACLPGEKILITEGILNKISGMESPEGLIAEIAMPSFVSLEKERLVLALDGVSDPGNVGTLLRTALALGWGAVYFLPGCCDPFNDKALRSARGAQFKLKLAKGSAEALQMWVEKTKTNAWVADLGGHSPEQIRGNANCLLVLGNEAHGASAEVRRFCQPVTIPMLGDMESLNVAVAGGILLYLFSTQEGL